MNKKYVKIEISVIRDDFCSILCDYFESLESGCFICNLFPTEILREPKGEKAQKAQTIYEETGEIVYPLRCGKCKEMEIVNNKNT